MAKVHVLADETLGGIKREYVEVDRKAKPGDIIVVTKDRGNHVKTYGEVREYEYSVTDFYFEYFSGNYIEDSYIWVTGGDEYKTLEPTSIVHIENERYKLVDRKAEVGERVIDLSDKGRILQIAEPPYDSEYVWYEFKTEYGTDIAPIHQNEYRVLEPVENSPQSFDGIIANLVRRVAELERELIGYKALGLRDHLINGNTAIENDVTGIKRDIETWAQEHEKTKRELDDKIEMVIDDIITLDERTEHINPIKARRCCGC